MAELEIEIKNKLGLHLRAAATLVKVTSQYKCEIMIKKDEEEVNGKSIGCNDPGGRAGDKTSFQGDRHR